MASILHLDTHSLIRILSFLDAYSLRNVLLTCKRLNELASDGRYWQTEVHRMRASYYLTELCFDFDPSGVEEVLKRALKSVSEIRILSDSVYDEIFENCGPVVAKLFKMIQNTTSDLDTSDPWKPCSKNSFELHLPSGLIMYISGSHSQDYTSNREREVMITVYVEKKKYAFYLPGYGCPINTFYFPDELADMQPSFERYLGEPFNMIYKEIGETQPLPLDPSFFYWFANIDWSCPSLDNSNLGVKYVFKDPESNRKTESSERKVKKVHLHEATCVKWLETMESWKKAFSNMLKYAADIVLETVGVLIKRVAEKALKSLSFDLNRILVISMNMAKYRNDVVKLMIRSTLFNPHPSKSNGSIATSFVEEFIAVRTKSGLLDLSMSASNRDFEHYPKWWEFILKYNLPNGQEYSVCSNTSSTRDDLDELQAENVLSEDFVLEYSEISKLQALTDIFQEKVNAQYQDAKHIPQLTNAFVLCYLVCATEFERYNCDPDFSPQMISIH